MHDKRVGMSFAFMKVYGDIFWDQIHQISFHDFFMMMANHSLSEKINFNGKNTHQSTQRDVSIFFGERFSDSAQQQRSQLEME